MHCTRIPAKAAALTQPQPINVEEDLTEFPWDDDDSLVEESDASIALSEDTNCLYPGGTNNNKGVYSESANDQALRSGICFTSAQYHETKLLKILSDANAAHYLYKDITEWGRAARADNYNFNPPRSTRNAQVKYLETWLHLQKSRPQQIPTILPGPGNRSCKPRVSILRISCLHWCQI